MHTNLEKLPIYRKGQWENTSSSPLITVVQNLVWLLRLFSIAAWLAPFFQVKSNNQFYTHRNFAEYYSITSLILSALVLFFSNTCVIDTTFALIWAVITIASIINYLVRLLILRPVFHINYSPYSSERTLVILILLYLESIIIFAIIYLHIVAGSFLFELSKLQSLELSTVTITTLASPTISAFPGSLGAMIIAFEALYGVLFLSLIIATAIGRMKKISPLDDD